MTLLVGVAKEWKIKFLMEKKTEYKTYLGRYHVLAAIALLSAQQNVSWSTFSPIAKEAREYYGLTNIEITLLPCKN